MKRLLKVAAVVSAAVLVVTGCERSPQLTAAPTSPSVSPAPIGTNALGPEAAAIAAAAAKGRQAGSVTGSMTFTEKVGGNKVSARGTVMTTYRPALMSQLTLTEITVNGRKQAPMEGVFNSTGIFVRPSGQSLPWHKMSSKDAASATGQHVAAVLAQAADPVSVVRSVAAAKNVREVGRDDGTTHYAGSYTMRDKLVTQLGEGPAQGVLKRLGRAVDDKATFDVWIDGEGYVRKFEIVESGTVQATSTVHLSGYGLPVTITPIA